MKLAILPRYFDIKRENYDFNLRQVINQDFTLMANELKIGLYSIMSPYECEDICSFCDGLIIPGSANKVNPMYYGEEPMNPPPAYDEFALDLKVMDCFIKNNKPVLGICAGHQAINIYFGGKIGRIIPDNSTKPHYGKIHPVTIKKDSFVYDALKTERTEINSYHVLHITKLGSGLDVVAKSDEGIIEAIENKERKIFGVQWHPEKSFREEDSIEKNIFKNFIECCKNR